MTRRVFFAFQVGLIPVAPFAAYVIGLVLGLDSKEALKAVEFLLPPLIVVAGMLQPWLVIDGLVKNALATRPRDAPGERLRRILELPQRLVVFGWLFEWMVGVTGFCVGCAVWFHKGPASAPAGLVVGMALAALIGIPLSLKLEEMFLPEALAEAARSPSVPRERSSFFWPRQRWFLPYTFGVFLLATVVLNGAVEFIRVDSAREQLAQTLEARGDASAAKLVRERGPRATGALGGQAAGTLNLLGVAGVAAWLLARRQSRAMSSVRDSLESLARGAPRPPEWVSTDEAGDLAQGLTALLGRLRELPTKLQGSVRALAEAGTHLRTVNEEQGEALVRQATALQQTRVTAEELRQTSTHAWRRAQAVIEVAERADQLGRAGEQAIDESLRGFDEMRVVVERMREQMAKLGERTEQIGGIAETVKDLADQSNMLALNAAIEAVRSGEHGRSFAVVAREIRSLADQSLRATRGIRESLDDLRSAIREAVSMSGDGARRVRVTFEKLKGSGEDLRELGGIVRESSAAVREIAAAVSQQNAGVTQLFEIFNELSHGVDETVHRLDATKQASRALETVSGEVSEVARRFDAA